MSPPRSTTAVEETGTQFPLHLRHVLGQCRLTQVHGFRGRAKAARLGHGQEHFELPESSLHKWHLISAITTSD